MYPWKYPISLFCIVWTLAGVRATPPLQVERHPPRKEPSYQQTPYYCLLVIGPEAKRHWLVLDGETVYLDRNGDGDLTSKEDRIPAKIAASIPPEAKAVVSDVKARWKVSLPDQGTLAPGLVPLGAVRGATGQAPFSNFIFQRRSSEDPKDLSFKIYTDDPKVLPKLRPRFENGVGITIGTTKPLLPPQPQKARSGIFVKVADGVLARRPQDAPILWFDGPLAMNLSLPDQTFLVRGDPMSQLFVQVGTFVTKNGRRVLTLPEIPSGVYPVADLEFPTKIGTKPIREQFVLKEHC